MNCFYGTKLHAELLEWVAQTLCLKLLDMNALLYLYLVRTQQSCRYKFSWSYRSLKCQNTSAAQQLQLQQKPEFELGGGTDCETDRQTERQRAEQTRLRMWHSYSCSRVATAWPDLCHSQRRLAVAMWQCGKSREATLHDESVWPAADASLSSHSTINWPTVIGNVSAAWQWLLPIGIELAPRRMLSMGTGMGAGEQPVACSRCLCCIQVDNWTSGQPLRVCVSGHSVHWCKNAVRRKWTVDE